jgi:hypothetical protein
MDYVVSCAGIRPVRCRDCQTRFYARLGCGLWGPGAPNRRVESVRRRQETRRRTLMMYGLALVAFAAIVLYLVRETPP